MKRATLIAALLLSGASATVVPPLDFNQQVRKAQVIVEATIVSVRQQERDGQRWNVYRLRITETLAGNAADLPTDENTPALWVLDGAVDAPQFKVDDQAILLLYRTLMDSPVVGYNQGVYRIRNGQVEGAQNPQLTTFKEAVARVRGAQ